MCYSIFGCQIDMIGVAIRKIVFCYCEFVLVVDISRVQFCFDCRYRRDNIEIEF